MEEGNRYDVVQRKVRARGDSPQSHVHDRRAGSEAVMEDRICSKKRKHRLALLCGPSVQYPTSSTATPVACILAALALWTLMQLCALPHDDRPFAARGPHFLPACSWPADRHRALESQQKHGHICKLYSSMSLTLYTSCSPLTQPPLRCLDPWATENRSVPVLDT